MKNREDEYLTKDIGEAAALLCKNFKLLRLQRDGQFFWFVFGNQDKECEAISKSYWFDRCLVNAKDFKGAIDTLKNRIFAQK